MQLTVKTLKGDKFVVEASDSDSVAHVKAIIESAKPELPADSMKLIHAGKVLKDEDSVGACQIKPNDFLVVMITKTKKPEAVVTAAQPAAQISETVQPAEVPPAPVVSAPTVSTTTATVAAATNVASTVPAEFPVERITALTSMGFPEPEAIACLRAARGNPDLAVEFLMNGIPPALMHATSSATSSTTTSATPSAASTTRPLDTLRNHPQINQLRQLVQSNPQMLPSILAQIAQQQPDLLAEINQHQAEFLTIMNEPISTTTSAPVAPSTTATAVASNPPAPVSNTMNPPPFDPSQLLRDLNPTQVQALSAAMGVSPEQLMATAQFLSSLPPHEMENFLSQMAAMQQDGEDDDGFLLGDGDAGGEDEEGGVGAGTGGTTRTRGGQTVIALTPDEMAAIQRLTELGFDRNLCVQAFLACDKNEALAANLLMDGGFGFDDFNDSHPNNPDREDDMYD